MQGAGAGAGVGEHACRSTGSLYALKDTTGGGIAALSVLIIVTCQQKRGVLNGNGNRGVIITEMRLKLEVTEGDLLAPANEPSM